MSLWSRWFGRAETRATLTDRDFWRETGLFAPVSSGVSVTPQTALGVPEVYSCVTVLAQDVGRCPLKLRVQLDTGEWADATGHGLWEILHDLPNPEMTATEFRYGMMRNLLTYERAYAEIVRRPNGQVQALWPLDPTRMNVSRDALNRKVYDYRVDGSSPLRWTFDANKPPILELRHPSPVAQCRDLIGQALAMDTYAAKFFANGARLSGLLVSKGLLRPEQRQGIRELFERMHRGADNAHRTGVVEGDVDYKPLTSPNNEAQFVEARKVIRSMIAGAFRVPPHKIGDLERATFANIEAQDRDYVNSALNPFLVIWEQAVRRDVLTTRQYPRYQAIFDREALIEADSQSRMQAFAIGRQNGWYSANDIRRKLHENPIPSDQGGDQYSMNGNMIPVGAEAPADQQVM